MQFAKAVTQTFERHSNATLLLQLASGERIETTPEHPFYVEGRGFVRAAELGIGTSIVTRAGPSVQVLAAQLEDAPATVYNLEVADFHTYFVGSAGAWVHNWCELPTGGNVIERDLKAYRTDANGNRLPGNPKTDFDEVKRDGDTIWIISKKDFSTGSIKKISSRSRESLGDYEDALKERLVPDNGVPNWNEKKALLDELYDPDGSKLRSGKIRIGLHVTHPNPPDGALEKLLREVSDWEKTRPDIRVGVRFETGPFPD